MVSALTSAQSGLAAGFARLDGAAARVATGAPAEPEDLVALLQSRQQVAANAAVVRTADDMIGTLLDVLA